ncbi:MAG: 1-(5-phosphoribosyl)-5-[(5-phosphoribosylamino)methylideneamino]imidazole-4-carboxamide isomerase [Rhodospirillaceae bacterium]|nr:1-(5-phosphoribosyl)-5-[(5-phosphoribosylamino)methylideneamino]imidazole-4-carboxamide isomerase [Rhodospirillaceae bacterium]
MILYPAIDLKEGAVVRLKRGAMDEATLYRDDPAAQARDFADAGAEWLHVVDLDGAISGRAVNGAGVDAILAAVSIPVQLGGGIRDMARAEAWIARGVARLVLGTAALKDPDFVRTACREFPGKVAIGIDARDGRVAIEGWAETSDMKVADLAKRFEDAGAAALIHTDIERDGMLSGVNVAATADLARATRLPVIASGGVASLEDLRALKAADAPIAGVISGRALYDGRLDLGAALALLAA